MYAFNDYTNTKCFCKVMSQFIDDRNYSGLVFVDFYLPKSGFSYKSGMWNPYIKTMGTRLTNDGRKRVLTFYVHPHFFNGGDLYNPIRLSIQDVVNYLYSSYITIL